MYNCWDTCYNNIRYMWLSVMFILLTSYWKDSAPSQFVCMDLYNKCEQGNPIIKTKCFFFYSHIPNIYSQVGCENIYIYYLQRNYCSCCIKGLFTFINLKEWKTLGFSGLLIWYFLLLPVLLWVCRFVTIL